MNNPFAPPSDAAATERASAGTADLRSWPSKADLVLFVVLALVLLPAALLNGLLWFEYFAGFGLYDPAVDGDPAWRARPVMGPLLVAFAAATRLALARGMRPLTRGTAGALTVLLTLAVFLAAIAWIPAPSFF